METPPRNCRIAFMILPHSHLRQQIPPMAQARYAHLGSIGRGLLGPAPPPLVRNPPLWRGCGCGLGGLGGRLQPPGG
jgi:hypothetical protein